MKTQPTDSRPEKREGNGRKGDGRFSKGNKGGGRPKLDPDVKAMLTDATPDRIRRLESLSKAAEKRKDYRTAAHIELSLLKKVVPDTNELLLGGVAGAPVQVDVKQKQPAKPTIEKLRRIAEVLQKAGVLEPSKAEEAPGGVAR